jgi:hypothetical protein
MRPVGTVPDALDLPSALHITLVANAPIREIIPRNPHCLARSDKSEPIVVMRTLFVLAAPFVDPLPFRSGDHWPTTPFSPLCPPQLSHSPDTTTGTSVGMRAEGGTSARTIRNAVGSHHQ